MAQETGSSKNIMQAFAAVLLSHEVKEDITW
jgi:hypothetical protein